MIGVYSSTLKIDGLTNINSIEEEHNIIIAEPSEISNLSNDKVVVFVFKEYSQVEEQLVYERGFEYYVNLKLINLVLTNIKKNRFGSKEVSLNEMTSKVTFGESEIQLSKKEYILFSYLNNNRGEICSRKTILVDVFDYHESAETRIVDVYVKHLRTKLGKEGKKIETIRGEGYIYHK